MFDILNQFFMNILYFIEFLEAFLWETVGFFLILFLGIYFTFKARGAQFYGWIHSGRLIKELARAPSSHGVSPIKLFFANVGGAVGVGNVVGICLAIQMGGPGALFWVWFVACVGVILKYTEVYLGMKYRIKTATGYDGGPMYYVGQAFSSSFLPKVVALLLCIYSIEIYQFNVMVESVSLSWGWPRVLVSILFLVSVLWTGIGGVKRVADVSTKIVPIFIAIYLAMSLWVLSLHYAALPGVLLIIFKSAFTGHAAVGGFAGAGFITCLQQGISRGCYASDIGIGYNALIHSETSEPDPSRQASLTLLGVLLDLLGVCSLSMLMILVTGVWSEPIESSLMVQTVLSNHFPYMQYFMPIMIALLGYSTVITFFAVGLKCAEYLNKDYGKKIFSVIASICLFGFSFFDGYYAMSVMALCGALLLVINLLSFWQLRAEVSFDDLQGK